MWDKKGENISYNWLYKLKEDLLNEQEEEQFTGDRKSTEALSALSDEQLVKYATARADKCNSMGYVSLGNKNKEKVTIIQKKLKSDGANIADPEGTFGLTTLVATIASQKQAGIRTDGCVGPETLSALGLSPSDFGMKVDPPQEPMQGAVDGQAEVEIAEYTGKITPSKRQRSLDRITSIVLHDTLTSSLRGMIGAFSKPRTYTTKSGEEKTYYTGTHFSITADGKVRQHAPLAFPTNHTGTGGWNSKSVGIDIVTRAGGTGAGYKGYKPPTLAQMKALYVLVSQLAGKLPALNKKVHWVDRWKLGGKTFNIPSGIVSHGMVQANRSDATFSSYYLKLRTQGMGDGPMGHDEAFKQAIEDEQAARLGQRTMVAENSFQYGENLTYKFLRLLREQQEKPVAIIAGDSQAGYSGKALEALLKQNGYDVFRKYRGSWMGAENTAKTTKRLSQLSLDKPVSLVVVFTGGNNPSANFTKRAVENLITTIRKNFGENVEIVIGAAPPARTGDPQEVKRIFRRNSHSEAYKAKRKDMADATVSVANSLGAKVVNPHTAGFLEDDVDTGDGIHLTDADALEFAQQIMSKVVGKQNVEVPASSDVKSVVQKIKDISKKRNVDFTTALFDLAYGSKDPKKFLLSIGATGLAALGAARAQQDKINKQEDSFKFRGKEKKDTVKRYSNMIRTIPAGQISYKYGDVAEDMMPKVIDAIEKASEKHGVDLGIMLAMAIYESGFNPYARTPLSSAAGLYAFLKSSGQRYGLQNYPEGFYDPYENADAAARMINNNIAKIERTTGRSMNPDDEYLIYVAHQQGAGGMRNIYQSAQRGLDRASNNTVHRNIINQGKYLRNIYKNGGPQAFLDFYKNKFSRTKSKGQRIANSVKGTALV